MSAHRSAFFAFFFIAAPVPMKAQSLPPEITRAINAATIVRVRLMLGARGTLYVPRVDSTTLSYDSARGGKAVGIRAPLSVGQIAEIEVKRGSHAGSGAMIGGGVGAGLALLLVAACQNNYCQPSAGEAIRLGVVLTAIGAVVGRGIGSDAPRWKTVYAVPSPRPSSGSLPNQTRYRLRHAPSIN